MITKSGEFHTANSKKLNRMKIRSILTTSMILLTFLSYAQDVRHITANEAVKRAIQNNDNIKMSELDRKIAHSGYNLTAASFLPQITAGYTAVSTNNPLNAFGFLLQQESVAAADFDPSKLNHPGASQNYSTQIEAKLPLLNIDAMYARKAAKAQEEAYSYKLVRTKEYIEFEVRKAYTQLQVSYQTYSILESSLEDVKQIHQSVSNFYKQGLVQKSDVLNAQVQVNTIEAALAKAKSNIHNASDGLRLLMGLEADEQVYTVDSISLNTSIYEEKLLSFGRSDIQAMNKAVEAADMMLKSSKMAFLPHINAFGSYGLNDSKAFKFRNDSYLIGINMSWTIFSGKQNLNKLKSAQFQQEKRKEELHLHIREEQLELNKTKRNLNDLKIEIDKQELSVEQADEARRILANRHREGLANTTDLLTAQAQLAQQKLLLAQSVMSYNITAEYLHFLSATNE